MTEQQGRFLRNEFLTLSLLGALGRSNTYVQSASESEKDAARAGLRAKLYEVGMRYVHAAIDDEQHCDHIAEIATAMTAKHSRVLREAHFRIGIAQKGINLYLKYLWCVGQISEPPHCPFDWNVLLQLRSRHPNWTAIDSLTEYMSVVGAARDVAGSVSLAVWELGLWNERPAQPIR